LEERSEKTKYVQRDLEDQIEEEYEAQGREYQRTDINSNNMSTSRLLPTIVVQDVLDLLKKGYTRLAKDDTGYGSIQYHYSLSVAQVKALFKHPKLKAKKTMPPMGINIVDREEPAPNVAEVLSTGGFAPTQDVVISGTEEPAESSPAEFILQRNQLFS